MVELSRVHPLMVVLVACHRMAVLPPNTPHVQPSLQLGLMAFPLSLITLGHFPVVFLLLVILVPYPGLEQLIRHLSDFLL